MELDELRRQWQQPGPADAPAPLDAASLTQLLAQQSNGIVEKLRRNARLELYINFGVMLGALVLAWVAQMLWLRLFGWVLFSIGGVCVVYLNRKLHLLRRMDDPAGDLRAHLRRLASGMRALIRFYFRFTLAMLPVAGLIDTLMAASTLHIGLTSPKGIGLLLGFVLGLPVLLYLPVASVTRRYLQRLYGQHLDRLETALGELDDEPTA